MYRILQEVIYCYDNDDLVNTNVVDDNDDGDDDRGRVYNDSAVGAGCDNRETDGPHPLVVIGNVVVLANEDVDR